jgi:hypothetical protein
LCHLAENLARYCEERSLFALDDVAQELAVSEQAAKLVEGVEERTALGESLVELSGLRDLRFGLGEVALRRLG